MKDINQILAQDTFTQNDIVELLSTTGKDRLALFEKSAESKAKHVGKKVYYRGLIEFSNLCIKDCLYCGIRKSNPNPDRYSIDEGEVLKAVKFAYDNQYASIVLQAGERSDEKFIRTIEGLLIQIKEISNGELGVTISLGEQTKEVYKRWKAAGAHRYLLRIESSNEELYYKIHPKDETHNFQERLSALNRLRDQNYQVGTGVMVGLPFQTLEHLASDLIFFKEKDFDMIGMGPYVEHSDTPLYEHKDVLLPQKERFDLTLKMIAILRIMMPDINIAAATALQAIDPIGREKALKVGANIIMPNITPTINRTEYKLYENKPCTDEAAEDCSNCLEARIHMAGDKIGYGEWGDSIHFSKRT